MSSRSTTRLPRHPYLRGHALAKQRNGESLSTEAQRHTPFAHVVVAAVVERDGRYLLVQEKKQQGLVINQPAGHWEKGESLVQAVQREVLEETGYAFEPTSVLGFYTYKTPSPASIVFLRVAFVGTVGDNTVSDELDEEIESVEWWSEAKMRENQSMMRSPLVLKMVEDLKIMPPIPLSVLHDLRFG